MSVSNMKAAMFNKKAKPDAEQVLKSLEIKSDDIIADIGSGGGFFTFEFAQITAPKGKVYAVDTNNELLAYIKKHQQERHLTNIQTIAASEKNANLPKNSCDLMFLRNVFHHIPEPVTYFRSLSGGLKPSGRIAIIEWKPGEAHHGHGTTGEEIIVVMTDAGYNHTKSFDFLDKQTFNVFQLEQ